MYRGIIRPITSRSVAAAIATGNAVMKSAEDTPLTTHELKVAKCALTERHYQHVTGFGKDVGAYLSSHPGIHQITFTGSVPTGIAVIQACQNIVPVTLELGGKSPNIVFADVNEGLHLKGLCVRLFKMQVKPVQQVHAY